LEERVRRKCWKTWKENVDRRVGEKIGGEGNYPAIEMACWVGRMLLVFVLLAKAQPSVSLKGGSMAAFATPQPSMMSALFWRRGNREGVCGCAGTDMVSGAEQSAAAGLDSAEHVVLPAPAKRAISTTQFTDSEIELRLLATRKEFEVSRDKKVEEKRAAYEQSLKSDYRRQTTHNYLTWVQVQQQNSQEDMEHQTSRQRRDDDFGETDDVHGGLREHGYVKKAGTKDSLSFLKSMPVIYYACLM
jgi:hypothetical protein